MNRFLFTQQNTDGSTSIYSTDGTVAGTTDLDVSRFRYHVTGSDPVFTEFDGKDLFLGEVGIATGSGFGSTDGTAAGTVVAPFVSDPTNDLATIGQRIDVVGGKALLSASTIHEDTSTAGPDEILVSSTGASYSILEQGVEVGAGGIVTSGKIGYFNAQLVDSQGNQQPAGLYRTDGTAAGTYEVDSTPAAVHSDIISLGNGKAVFASQDADGNDSLWVTDGSRTSATQIVNTQLGSNIVADAGGATIGNKAIFTAIDAANNISIWTTDGTAAGSHEIDVQGSAANDIRTPSGYTQSGNRIVFDTGYIIASTNGTAGITGLSPEGITGYAVAGSKVYYELYGSSSSIFVVDSTGANPAEITVAGAASLDGHIKAIGDQVVFSGTDTSGNQADFGSDGTVAGTGEISLPAGLGIANINAIGALPVSAPPIVTLGPGDQVYQATSGQAVVAGSGNDTVIASAGGVTVTGSGGHLTFFGGTGASSVFGGSGSSLIFGGTGGGHFISGTAGGNILVSQGAAGGNTTLTGAGAGDQIFGSAKGNDVLIAGAGRESVLGGGGPTTIQGGSAASVIFTGSGSTEVYGGTGAGDTIVGGSGTLAVTANAGDAIFGNGGHLAVTGSSSGADSIVGGAGGLAVTGTGGNMLVVGGSGASTIATGNGASLIFEGTGSSTVTGGAGSMQVEVGSGKASVTDGTGPTAFDVVKGAAGGTDMLSGFKVGADTISLFGYAPGDVHVSTGSGNTVVALADGTKIEILGVTNLGGSLVV